MTDQQAPQFDAPAQAWAQREGLVDLQPLAAASWTPDAVQARLQIAETFSRFAMAHDEARVDLVLSCFTEDGILQVSQGHALPFTTQHGRGAIGAELTNIIGQQDDQRRHLISNVVVDRLEATTAHALAYGLVSAASGAYGLRLGASVIYVADLAREADGCWRFTRFHIGMDTYAGAKPTPLGG
jgi:SnoaL-like domain